MVRLGLIVVIAVTVRVGSGSAHAEVTVDAGVPFSAAELSSLLALRGAMTNDISVRAVSSTEVELATPVGRQRVYLGVARGTAAARLVALQLATLGGGPAQIAGPPLALAAPALEPDWAFGIAGGGGHGVAAIDFALTAVRIDAITGRGRWRWGATAAWLHGLAKTPDGIAPATADLYPLRAVAGLAIGRVQVVAGPALVAYRVTAASSGLSTGAGGSVRLRFAGDPGWSAVASVDLDGFVHRIIVERAGVATSAASHTPFAATPRVAITASLGLTWGRS
jgi:hypothetical protein